MNKLYQYIYWGTIAMILFFGFLPRANAQVPANDNCTNAINIPISSGGFGLGVFTSTTIRLGDCTKQFGEVFHNSMVSAGNDKKSVWFKFHLETARAVNLALKQPGILIPEDGAGFAVYYTNTCLPSLTDIPGAKLTPLSKFGSSYNPCLPPGDYLIQVGAKLASVDDIFMQLTISAPGVLSTYDERANAQNLGTLSGGWDSYSYDVGCLSIESATETCAALTSEYTQSSWHVFTTDNKVDLVRFEMSEGTFTGDLHVGFKVYRGDARTTPIASLTLVEDCSELTQTSSGQWVGKTFLCDFLPNTKYSIQIFYHKDYSNTVNYRLYEKGSGTTKSPNPSALNASSKLGVLPSSGAGVWTYGKDTLACNSFIASNSCGTVNPASGVVTSNGVNYVLNTWYTFTIAADANVRFYTTNYLGKRLFSGNVESSCNKTPIWEWNSLDASYNCLSAGTYSIQLLGLFDSINVSNYYYNMLGENANLNIQVTSVNIVNNYQLISTGKVDSVNRVGAVWQALPDGVQIYSKSAMFGCPNTVLPAGDVCSSINKKAIYREIVIGDGDGNGTLDNGILTIGGLNYNFMTYRLYKGDASALATTQSVFSYPSTITGLTDLAGCFATPYTIETCVTPGIYTLVTFGDSTDVAISDQPWFQFDIVNSIYNNPAAPDNLGDITAAITSGTKTSPIDYFCCVDNPLTINGTVPCPSTTKQLYHQFYISSPKILNISQSGGNYLRLFAGRISDGVGTLSSSIAGYGDLGCVGAFYANVCKPIPAGWYTVVVYGQGANYAGSPYTGGLIGDPVTISISTTTPPLAPQYNRPSLAYNAGTTDWGPNSGTAAYPVNGKTYTFGTEHLNCSNDLPFPSHPVNECDASLNRVGYFVFTITKESFISIGNIPSGMESRIYNLNALVPAQAALFPTATPVQECINRTDMFYYESIYTHWIGKIEVCKMQPGTYTLVVFAGDGNIGSSYTPQLYVDETGTSRFDHAKNAYDFGLIPGDSTIYLGKVGDSNPLNASRAPSNDFFFCTTNANSIDPGAADAMRYCWDGLFPSGNLSVNTPNSNNNTLYSGSTNVPIRRNLWYTYVVDGPGKVSVSVYNKTTGKTTQMPFAIYESNVDGTLPFATVVSTGAVDSTIAQGLTFVTNSSYEDDWVGCAGNSQTISYPISPCDVAKKRRYYIVVDQHSQLTPVDQVEVGVKFEPIAPLPIVYDHYFEANVINGLNQTAAPYTAVALTTGDYSGATGSFPCATKDAHDQNSCGTRTLWYKFTSAVSGKLRINYEIPAIGTFYNIEDMMLFKEVVAGDSTSNGLQQITPTFTTVSGLPWGETCLGSGTYYILLTGCSYNIETVIPHINLTSQSGDLCSDPATIVLTGVGSGNATTNIDCHTMGEDYGEDGSSLGCLFGPTGYKSSWFRVDLNYTDKVDLTFSLSENTTALPSQIRYRVLYGDCGAMSPGPCNTDALTEFTLNCMESNSSSYFIQVVSPASATGTISLSVSATLAPNQSCLPIALPLANFTVNGGCAGTPYCFINQSTMGSNMRFHWDFGIDSQIDDTSNAINPCFTFPIPTPSNSVIEYNVSLIAINMSANIADTVVIPVSVYPAPTGSITRTPSGATITAGTNVDFDSNTGNSIADPATTWEWTFNNSTGTTSSSEDVAGVTYGATDLGLKTVYLNITNGTCVLSLTNSFTVGYEPVFVGGFYDGSHTQSSLGCPIEPIFVGGPYDGANAIFTDGCPEEPIFVGGPYDGAGLNLAEGCPVEPIFVGGFYDGATANGVNLNNVGLSLANSDVCVGSSTTLGFTISGTADSVMWNSNAYITNPWATTTTGDFKSKRVTGNWSDFNSWLRYNGGSWVAAVAGQIPITTSKVEISAGAIITIDNATSVCQNLIVSGTLLRSASNKLTVYGSITTRQNNVAMPAWANNDYRSKVTGNWNTAASWEIYNGSAWVAAAAAPNSTTAKVWIQDGHTITATSGVSCKLLYIPGTGKLVDSGTPWLTISDAWPNNAYPNANMNVAEINVAPSVATQYYISAKAANACDYYLKDTLINVIIAPIANAGPDVASCGVESKTIGTAGVTGYTYTWTPTTGLSDANIAQPIASPSATTTYTVSVRDIGLGCAAVTDQVTVTVEILPVLNSPDLTVCTPDLPVTLTPTYTGTADSWAWYNMGEITNKLPVYISNGNSDLTNFQVKIILNTAALISANKMKSDCGDLRVFDTDGTTSLNYWIVDGTCNTASTEIWVKVPSLPSSSSSLIQPLADANLSSSSIYSADLSHIYSRLNSTVQNNWVPGTQDQNQWIKADFGSVKTVNKIATQGRHSAAQWVTSYKISYSNDNATWTYLGGSNLATATTFTGNTDQNTVVENSFTSFSARYVRLHPWTWNSYQGLRWEIYQDPAPTPKTINFTYGSPILTTTSNGTNVFEFFDDFNGNSIDGSKWTTGNIGTPTAGTEFTESGGNLNGTNMYRNLSSTTTFTGNYIAQTRVYETTPVANGFTPLGFYSSTGNNVTILSHNGTSYMGVNGGWPASSGYTSVGAWVRDSIVANGTSGAIRRYNESSAISYNPTATITALNNHKVRLSTRGDDGTYAQDYSAKWDWLFVRKYSATTPTYTFGTEVMPNPLANTQTCTNCGTAFESYLVVATKGACIVKDTVTVIDASTPIGKLQYRTRANGNWTSLNTWDVYDVNTSAWVAASTFGACGPIGYPTSYDSLILVQHDVVYDFTIPQGVDEFAVASAGVLRIPSGITFNMVDSSSSVIAEDLMNYGRINIAGTFTVVGTALLSNDDNSIVAYINGDQTMWNGKYGKLEADGGGVKTVSGTSTRANTDVKFINGWIQLGNRNFRLGSLATTTGAAYATGWFVTNGPGQVIKESMSNYSFHVGPSSLAYNKAILNNTGTADNIGVRVNGTFDFHPNFPNDALADSSSVNRTWYLTEQISGGSNISIDVYWVAADENSAFNRSVCHYGDYNPTSGWDNVGSTGAALGTGALTNQYHYSYSGITTLRQYGVGSCAFSALKYRTIADGNWTNVNIWEVYDNASSSWITAPLMSGYCGNVAYPSSVSDSVWVRHNVTYDVTIPEGIDQTIVQSSAVISVPTSIDMIVVNGVGNDLFNSGKIIVTGSMTVQASANLNNQPLSIVHYNGGTQSIYNGAFAKLWIDGTAINAGSVKQLTGSLTSTSEQLWFINGKIDLGVNDISLLQNCVVTNAGQNTGYLVATNTGSCIWTYPTGTSVSKTYPVGGVYYSYSQIQFENVNSAGTLKVRVKETAHPTDGTSIKRYWTINKMTIDFTGYYDASFLYNDNDLPSIPTSLADEMVMVSIAGAYSTSYTSSNNWYYSPTNINNALQLTNNIGTVHHNQFSDFTFFPPKTNLPVEMSFLNAYWQQKDGIVQWTTLSETNNSGFWIERSTNAVDFVQMDFVDGAGNSNSPQLYQWKDENLIAREENTFYYRLRQVDFDGTEKTTSTVLLVKNNPEHSDQDISIVSFGPNPLVDNRLTGVFLVNNPTEYTFVIYDMLGQIVYNKTVSLTVGMNKVVFELNSLAPGGYLIKEVKNNIKFKFVKS